MSEVWVITDESYDPRSDCDGTSLRGVFSTLENCFRELVGCNFGRDVFASITWSHYHDGYWEGHNANHTRCYKVSRQEPDACLPDEDWFSAEDLAAIRRALATPAVSNQ